MNTTLPSGKSVRRERVSCGRRRLLALAMVLLASCGVLAGHAAAQPVPKQKPSAPRVNVTMPDSIKVSVNGTVPVSTRLDGIVTVWNADPTPWWDLGFFSALFGTVVGAMLGGVFLLLSLVVDARRKRWQLHRDSLARLERRCVDYMNQIITERRLAGEARTAAETRAVSWRFPRVMEIDPSFGFDIVDLDMNVRVTSLNTELARYNRDVEDLIRCRDDLQPLYLEAKIPDDLWHPVMASEAEVWRDIGPHLDAVDEMVRDIKVRAVMLVEQFNTKKAERQRFFGLGSMKAEPLVQSAVDRERQDFEAERARLLEANRQVLEQRYGPRGSSPSKPNDTPV